MRRFRLALFGWTLVGSTLSCFAEQPAPSTYRYTCREPKDCRASEACIQGLCQVPCTLVTAEADCGSGGYAACLNGACASLCDPQQNHCPDPQRCIDLGVAIDESSNNSLLGGSTPSTVGLCASSCIETGCGGGEICVPFGDNGVCLVPCAAEGATCPATYSCLAGACVPDSLLETPMGDTAVFPNPATSTVTGTTTTTPVPDEPTTSLEPPPGGTTLDPNVEPGTAGLGT